MVLAGCFGHVFSDMELTEGNKLQVSVITVSIGHVFSDMEISKITE